MSLQTEIDRAVRHHARGELDEAESIYRQILAHDPNHAHALHLLGIVAHQRGDQAGALSLVERAIAINGAVGDFYNTRGEIYRAMGRIDDALEQYRLATDRGGDCFEAYQNWGTALRDIGKVEQAISCWQKALQIRPTFHPAQASLAEVYDQMGVQFGVAGDLPRAIAAIQKALELLPDYAPAQPHLGIAYEQQKKFPEAVAEYRAAVRLDPNLSDATYNLAAALIQLRQIDEAVALLEVL